MREVTRREQVLSCPLCNTTWVLGVEVGTPTLSDAEERERHYIIFYLPKDTCLCGAEVLYSLEWLRKAFPLD